MKFFLFFATDFVVLSYCLCASYTITSNETLLSRSLDMQTCTESLNFTTCRLVHFSTQHNIQRARIVDRWNMYDVISLEYWNECKNNDYCINGKETILPNCVMMYMVYFAICLIYMISKKLQTYWHQTLAQNETTLIILHAQSCRNHS